MTGPFHCQNVKCQKPSQNPPDTQENRGRFIVCPHCGAKHRLVATVDEDGNPKYEIIEVVPQDASLK